LLTQIARSTKIPFYIQLKLLIGILGGPKPKILKNL